MINIEDICLGESITITCRDVPLHLAKMFMEQVRNIQNRNEEQHDRNLYSHRSTGSMATGGDYINNSDEDNDHRCSIFGLLFIETQFVCLKMCCDYLGQTVADTCRHLKPRLANRFIREVRKIQNNIESEAKSKPCVRCSRFHMG